VSREPESERPSGPVEKHVYLTTEEACSGDEVDALATKLGIDESEIIRYGPPRVEDVDGNRMYRYFVEYTKVIPLEPRKS